MRTKMKRFLGILLCLAMIMSQMTCMTLTAYALPDMVKYLDADGVEKSQSDCTRVSSSIGNVGWGDSWYVIKKDATISGNVKLNGNVNLILCDGAKLTVDGYIYSQSSYHNLSVYAQSTDKTGMGAFIINSGIECSDLTINGDNRIIGLSQMAIEKREAA